MGLLGGINVKFSADLSNLSQGFSKATSLIASFGGGAVGPMGIATAAIAGVGIAAVGMAASSVKAAGDFQQSMLKVQAYAGLSKQQADQMSQSILKMSTAVGVGPKELADALYPIISSGYSASQAMTILSLSAKTAAASGAQTSSVADGLTTSLKAMNAPASDAAKYMDIMNKTVAQGKTEFPAYASVIGKISLTAKSANVPFLDMNAALATLTTHGFPSVAQASTSLGNLLTQVGPKVDKMATNAKKMGLSFDESAFKGMSLSDKIAYLNKVTGGNQGEILKLVGGSTLALKAFNSLSGSSQDYANNLKALQGAQGTTASVFATASSGYNFHMQQMNAAFQVLQVTVGNALLPIITQLMNIIQPLIAQFTNWISAALQSSGSMSGLGNTAKQVGGFILNNLIVPVKNLVGAILGVLIPIGTWLVKSGALNTAFGLVKGAVSGIVTVIGGLISGIGNVIDFFNKNHDAALALLIPLGILGGYFVYLGVQAIASFIAAAPAMITGFITGATAAWTMAAGVIAATWPFLLIGAAIGIVIAIIVLLVQHWGQVVSFLKTTWSAFTSWFGQAIGAVGKFFSNVWNDIILGLKLGWNNIVNGVKAGLKFLLDAFLAPFNAIIALFDWLYQHNVYFQKLIDAIKAIVTAGLAWLENIWNNDVKFLTNIWTSLTNIVTNAWNSVKNAIMTVVLAIGNWEIDQWNKATKWLTDKWNSFKDIADTAWKAVSGVFSSIWNKYIAGPLGTAWNSISGWFNNLATQAVKWGENLINSFITGIKNNLTNLGNTVSGAMGTVAKFMGFHSPAKEGPGSEADQWAPNLISMFALGLTNGLPKVAKAAAQVASAAGGMAGAVNGHNTNYPISTSNASIGAGAPGSAGNSSSTSGDIHVHVEMDGTEIAHMVGNKQTGILRAKAGRRFV